MASTFSGKAPANTYKDILHTDNNNAGVSSTPKRVGDGNGGDTALFIGTNAIEIYPKDTDGKVFVIRNAAGTTLFSIDTTTNTITAASGVSFAGDGSLLTGVLSAGTGGTTSTTNVQIVADSGANGSGDILFLIGAKEVLRIPNSYGTSLPTGVAGNYILKTVQDNWGKPAGGYLLDGVDDYLTVTDNDAIDFGTGNFSIEIALNAQTFKSDVILTKNNSTTAGYRLTFSSTSATSSKFKLLVYTAEGAYTLESASSLVVNRDYHLVATINRTGSAILYINGVQDATSSVSTYSSSVSTATALTIAANSGFQQIMLYQIRLFNRVLTLAEIVGLYDNGKLLARLPYADIGANNTNILQNGDFAASTGWTAEAGWAIADGVATGTAVTGYLYQNKGLVNKRFRITYTVTVTSGSVKALIGNTLGTERTTSGTYTEELVSTAGTNAGLYGIRGIAFTGTVDNITIIPIGCTAEYLPLNAGRLGWIESSGNQLSATTIGLPVCLNTETRPCYYRDIKKTIAANTNTTLTAIIPKGYIIKTIRAKGSDSLADIKIGSSSAGEQVVAASTTSGTTATLLTLAATANATYSETADITLYARHDTSASGKTMDLIFHLEKVGN